MSKYLTIFLVFPFFTFSQSAYHFAHTIPVTQYGVNLQLPWAGGINYPEWSQIDFNMDGNQDLFMFDRSNNRVITLISNGAAGTGQFQLDSGYAAMFPKLTGWAFLYDYSCDGLPDLFTVNNRNNGILQFKSSYSNNVWMFTAVDSAIKNDYGGTNPGNILASGNLVPNLNDIDNDGDMDILGQQFNCVGMIAYYKNMSMEHYGVCDSLDDYLLITNGWGNFALRAGGYQYVSANLGIICPVMAPEEYANWDPSEAARRDDTYAQIFTIDLDGDNDKDVLLGDAGAVNVLQLINGGTINNADMISQDTLFPSYNVPALMNSFTNCSYVDVDNDSLKDLLVGNSENENRKGVYFYKNQGTNTSPVFARTDDSLFQSGMIDVGEGAAPVFYDVDQDGLLDIIIGNIRATISASQSKTNLSYYRNTGTALNPSFELMTDNFANLTAQGIPGTVYPAFGDMDGDGDKDLVVGDYNGKLNYYNNTGTTIQFVQASYMNIDVGNFSTPQIIDLNRDGKLDFVIGEQNGFLNYFENSGTTTIPAFSSTPTIDTLGGVNVRVVPYTDGYSVPYFYDDSGQYRLYVSNMEGNIFQFDNIDGNLSGVFNFTDTLFQKDFGHRFGFNHTVSGGDLNHDGYNDLVIGLYGGGIQVYLQHNPYVAVEENVKPSLSAEIHPNPANDFLEIRLNHRQPGKKYSATLFNMIGESVFTMGDITSHIRVDTGSLPAGIYMLQVYGNGEARNYKVVISH